MTKFGKAFTEKISALLGRKILEKPVCCSNTVHIAFRGISDDRMYCSYNRQWLEVKYFRPNGLRVFCAQCRRRVL